MSSWAGRLFSAFAQGELGADELWTLVLDCHAAPDPDRLLARVLDSYGELLANAEIAQDIVVLDEAM
jgi:hypothetical protein